MIKKFAAYVDESEQIILPLRKSWDWTNLCNFHLSLLIELTHNIYIISLEMIYSPHYQLKFIQDKKKRKSGIWSVIIY